MKTTRQAKLEAKQLFRLCLVNGTLDEDRARQVVERVVSAKRRRGLVLLSQFLRLMKLDFARHTAEVESAAPLPSDLRAHVQAGLLSVYGPNLKVSFEHNPGLVGGMRIKVGSYLYDGSVRARLAELEKSF
jgi:F-type H+-transporting ATPase subunit delta